MRPGWGTIRCLLPIMMVVRALTAQNSTPKQNSGNPPMGASTGIAHAPIKDDQSRPIIQIGSLLAKWLEARIPDSSGGLRSRGHRGKRC